MRTATAIGIALFAVVIFGAPAAIVSAKENAASVASDGLAPYPSELARDMVIIRQSIVRENYGKPGSDGDPPDPDGTPEPGDTIEHSWTECPPSQTQCTRYSRTDRWQREDAAPEDDPTEGTGDFDWVPWKWTSRNCATLIICQNLNIGWDPH